MTEREQKVRGPSNKAILEAIESLGLAYHQFASALQAREEDDRRERRAQRETLDRILGTLERLQQQIDRRFDQVWKEVDALRERVDKLEADHG